MPAESVVLDARARPARSLSPDLCGNARLVLCDLDGCLISEGRAFDDAPAFVEACGHRLWIVSNNSSDTAATLSAHLSALGLVVPSERILLAGEQTLLHLARTQPDARLGLYANPALQAAATVMGFELATTGPDIALLCRDVGLTLDGLGRLAAHIAGGAEFWISNIDITHPGLAGQAVPETGTLLAALKALLPNVRPQCLGKPDPFLLDRALQASGHAPEAAIFVGDNADTDGDAARKAGIHFVHLVRGRTAP